MESSTPLGPLTSWQTSAWMELRRAVRVTAVFKTIPAEVDETGAIRPEEPVRLPPGAQVLVTVLEDETPETALLSEPALAADWERPEEEAAWSHSSQG
jgi:hypothetical protein